MNFKVESNLLGNFLPLLKELCSNKQSLIYFEQLSQQSLKSYTTDNDRFLSVVFPIEDLTDIQEESINSNINETNTNDAIGLNAMILTDIVKKGNSSKTWEIKTTSNEILMTQGIANVKLIKSMESKKEPQNTNILYDFIIDLAWLKDAIRKVIFAMSQDDRRPILKGILFKIEGNKLDLVCSDNYRLALKTVELEQKNILLNTQESIEIVLPSRTASTLLHLLDQTDGFIRIQGDKTKVELLGVKSIKASEHVDIVKVLLEDISNENIIKWHFHSALVAGNFPQYERVFKLEGENIFTCNAQDLYKVLDQVGVMSQDTHIVTLTLRKDHVFVASTNVNIGEYTNVCDGKLEKDGEYRINFRIGFLMDLLKIFGKAEVNIKIAAANRPMLFESELLPNFKTIIVPLSGS